MVAADDAAFPAPLTCYVLMCWYLHHNASACHNGALALMSLEDLMVKLFVGNHDPFPSYHEDVLHMAIASISALFRSSTFRLIMLGNTC